MRVAATAGTELLELHEPEGAFRRLEDWLGRYGFFAEGGDELVADLYLGYGLSQVLRRRTLPPPREPCPLPLAACAIRAERGVVDDGPLSFGPWERTWDAAAYAAAVARVREAIARGDV
jgi:hypothetical protein